MAALWLIVLCGALAIAYAVWATRSVLAQTPAAPRMQEISAAVREGAQAYLKRQYTTIAMVGIVIFFIMPISRLAGGDRISDRRNPLRRRPDYRNECFGARQRPHGASGDPLAGRRA